MLLLRLIVRTSKLILTLRKASKGA
ncbi:hypothetical protein Gohar_026895 [Gossypium harknessii]|uniref:Uncharacterized protein n=1 Tax=Gossypium harknessii TaxID=34285 RepID=A0A7J9HSY4_9ROSI|nr:hypothetical protein [Gossypium harknessii]